MPLREFTDADRRTWQVWDTVPKSATENVYFAQNARLLRDTERQRYGEGHLPFATGGTPRFTEGREHGWLTFMCADEKRRLSPIPERWAEASDEELGRLLSLAEKVPRTTGLDI